MTYRIRLDVKNDVDKFEDFKERECNNIVIQFLIKYMNMLFFSMSFFVKLQKKVVKYSFATFTCK